MTLAKSIFGRFFIRVCFYEVLLSKYKLQGQVYKPKPIQFLFKYWFTQYEGSNNLTTY